MENRLGNLLSSMIHQVLRPAQEQALLDIAAAHLGMLLELPTGAGKTDVGMGTLKAFGMELQGRLFYVTPTKALVEQVKKDYPDAILVYGRAEYPCLYYVNKGLADVNAEQSPCAMLNCGCRVSQADGTVQDPTATPCPYLAAKWRAVNPANTQVIVCTTAFYLMNRLYVNSWKDEQPAAVVFDEAHRLASVARSIFQYRVTNTHLSRMVGILKAFDKDIAKQLNAFRQAMIKVAARRYSTDAEILKQDEIEFLLNKINVINPVAVSTAVRQALSAGMLDPVADLTTLKVLENLIRNIPRLIKSLSLALEKEDKHPLTYVIASYRTEPQRDVPKYRWPIHLDIKSYYVRPLIKRTFGQFTLAYSATIGDPQIVGYESGLDFPFKSYASNFDAAKTRIFMPSNTPDLRYSRSKPNDHRAAMKMMSEAVASLAANGVRSLVILVSNDERTKFLARMEKLGIDAISYGNGVTAKDAATLFKAGEGKVLVGTSAHYSEGIDLPKQTAPVIFVFRPGFAPPSDPECQFEEKRFGKSMARRLRQWRVMINALQVRGRNVRSTDDLGVCIFISQQFRDFLYGSLPAWLHPAYRKDLTLEGSVTDTLKLLGITPVENKEKKVG